MKLPSKSLERQLVARGYTAVVGIDEVGMGCLAGPVVVCAALFVPAFYRGIHRQFAYLRDSKLLQPVQRERYAVALKAHQHIQHAVAVVYPKEIDRLNIYQAARTGMRRALRRLGIGVADRIMVLVDGSHPIAGIPWEQEAIVKGDRKIFSIAAASVIAKVHRDGMMVRYARRYPEYGFEVHKGYATPLHRRRLAECGSCEIHRKSFVMH